MEMALTRLALVLVYVRSRLVASWVMLGCGTCCFTRKHGIGARTDETAAFTGVVDGLNRILH